MHIHRGFCGLLQSGRQTFQVKIACLRAHTHTAVSTTEDICTTGTTRYARNVDFGATNLSWFSLDQGIHTKEELQGHHPPKAEWATCGFLYVTGQLK